MIRQNQHMFLPKEKAVMTQISPKRQKSLVVASPEVSGCSLDIPLCRHPAQQPQSAKFYIQSLELYVSSLAAAALHHEHLAMLLEIYSLAHQRGLFPCHTAGCGVQTDPAAAPTKLQSPYEKKTLGLQGKLQVRFLQPTLIPEEELTL